GEEVLDDPHVRVVVERKVDVRARDEVDRDRRARGAADGDADVVATRAEEEERRWEDGSRPLLGIAVEAPGPLSRLDPPRGELAELDGDVVHVRGHEVEKDALAAAERRVVQVVVRDEALMLGATHAREADALDA